MSLEDFLIGALCLAIGGFAAFLALAALYYAVIWLYRLIFLQFCYGEVSRETGRVTNMKYTPPRTTVARNVVTTTPAKNEVFIVTRHKQTHLDNDRLYQRVRIGEKIFVEFQKRYSRPRFWSGDWTLDGFRLLSITSEKKDTVEFNNRKPVLERS